MEGRWWIGEEKEEGTRRKLWQFLQKGNCGISFGKEIVWENYFLSIRKLFSTFYKSNVRKWESQFSRKVFSSQQTTLFTYSYTWGCIMAVAISYQGTFSLQADKIGRFPTAKYLDVWIIDALQGTRSALYANNRESISVTVQEVTPRSVGAMVALYERAVGLYASLVNINAYHQPGNLCAINENEFTVYFINLFILILICMRMDPNY